MIEYKKISTTEDIDKALALAIKYCDPRTYNDLSLRERVLPYLNWFAKNKGYGFMFGAYVNDKLIGAIWGPEYRASNICLYSPLEIMCVPLLSEGIAPALMLEESKAEGWLSLSYVVVDKMYRQQGIATHLLKMFSDYADSLDDCCCVVETQNDIIFNMLHNLGWKKFTSCAGRQVQMKFGTGMWM